MARRNNEFPVSLLQKCSALIRNGDRSTFSILPVCRKLRCWKLPIYCILTSAFPSNTIICLKSLQFYVVSDVCALRYDQLCSVVPGQKLCQSVLLRVGIIMHEKWKLLFLAIISTVLVGIATIGIYSQRYNPDKANKKCRECIHMENFVIPTVDMAMSRAWLTALYYDMITTHTFQCRQSERIGRDVDGGWDVCVANQLKPKPPCLSYSFGVNYIWEFDDETAKHLGCEVRAFDPSMKMESHKRSDKVWFYNIGLYGKTSQWPNGWKMMTFSDILAAHNHTEATIDILKIDIEFSEWYSFHSMIKTGALKNVKQLLLESHTQELGLAGPITPRMYFYKLAQIWIDLYKAGFRQWKFHKNLRGNYIHEWSGILRSCCFEHYLVNIAHVKTEALSSEPTTV